VKIKEDDSLGPVFGGLSGGQANLQAEAESSLRMLEEDINKRRGGTP